MIKKTLLLLTVLTVQYTWSCDICGGGSQWLNTGLQPQFNQHYFGISGSFRKFLNPETSHSPSASQDQLFTLNATGRFSINDKLQFSLSLPYSSNSRTSADEKKSTQGIGDIQFQCGSLWMNKGFHESKFRLFLQSQFSFRLPTKLNKEQTLPLAMRPSLGSYGVGFSVNGMLASQSWAIASQWGYFYSFMDENAYQMADQWVGNLQLYWFVPIGKLKLAPHFQARGIKHGVDYQYDYPVMNANEQRLNLGFGLDVYKEKFAFISNVYFQGWEKFETELPTLKKDIVVSFIYFINHKKQ